MQSCPHESYAFEKVKMCSDCVTLALRSDERYMDNMIRPCGPDEGRQDSGHDCSLAVAVEDDVDAMVNSR